MIRLLVIGHAYVVTANRGKFPFINEDEEVEVYVACPVRWKEPEFGLRILDAGTEAYPVSGLSTRMNGHVRYTTFHWRELGALFKKVRPHVVQIEQEPASLMAWQCVRQARKADARIVFFTWDNISGGQRFLLERIARSMRRKADYILAGNRAALKLLESKGHGVRSEVLPQIGVDIDLFNGKRSVQLDEELGLSGFVVGYAGRLVKRKGVFDLLESFAKIATNGSADATLLFLGDGPEKEPLKKRAQQLGILEKVCIADGVPHEEVAIYMASMAALVLPSRTTKGWTEQFGHVLIEAMASGIPVVGSNAGAIPEVIGDAGFVFPEGDTGVLSGILGKLMEDEEYRVRWGQKGRQRVFSRYTDEAIAKRTVEIARMVLGGKNSKA